MSSQVRTAIVRRTVRGFDRYEVRFEYPDFRIETVYTARSQREASAVLDGMRPWDAGPGFIVRGSWPQIDHWRLEDVPGHKLAITSLADRLTLLVPRSDDYLRDAEAFAARHWQAFVTRMNWEAAR
jgi:hypothetical protein